MQDSLGEHSMKAYQNSWEYISDELMRLNLLIRRNLSQLDKPHHDGNYDEFMGLFLSDEEINGLLDNKNQSSFTIDSSEVQGLDDSIKELKARISERRAISLDEGIHLSLPRLSYLFHLTPFEEDVILICLACELDLEYERLYAYLQNDVTRKKPSIDLILKLLCHSQEEQIAARSCFSTQSSLLKYRLLQFCENSPANQTPLLSRPLKLDDRIVNFLLELTELDNRLESFARLVSPQISLNQVAASESLKSRLHSLTRWYLHEQTHANRKLLYLFHGAYGTGKKSTAEALCREFGIPLIVADVAGMLTEQNTFEETVWRLFREALLLPAALYLENFDLLLADEEKQISHLKRLIKAFEEFSLLTFFASEKLWEPKGLFKEHYVMDVEFPLPDYSLRKTWWDASLNEGMEEGLETAELANKFRFSGGQIRDAVNKARNITLWQTKDGTVSMEALYAACRAQSNQKLSTLARKIQPKYTWDDIILPKDQKAQLREMCNYLKYRPLVYGEWGFDRKLSLGKGLNALFHGPSGTGKTMAAEIMANELQLDLYKIDLSQVVSKYIGETEKNLDKIFTEAETSNAILFFDEADALFGKRSEVKDAHDRYANIEIGYLLQKMEEYEGMTILATNLRKNMDEAFVRRLRFSVEFPFPDRDDRRRIWEITFPPEAPKEEDIDFDYLAKQFKITGGNIKNIVLYAAFLAAEDGQVLFMKHIIHAVRREFQKMGKLCMEEDFGKYYHLLTEEA
jgi:SpoVK/Ycf46/Vps4 family AAA+-type ATPase